MSNKRFILIPVALFLFSLSSYSQAASSAQITITGNVQSTTCDVDISTNSLDLGALRPADFTAVAKPVAESVRAFSVGLNNCTAPAAAGTAGLMVTGQTLFGNTDIFSSGTTNTGVMLNQVGTSTYIKSGETLEVAKVAGDPPADNELNGKTLALQAGLAKGNDATADVGRVSAPILFQFVYN